MRIRFALLALLVALFALPSRADSIDYTLKFDASSETLIFSLPVNPLPSSSDSTGFSIHFVPGNLDGFGYNFDIDILGTDLLAILDEPPNLVEIVAHVTGNSMPLFSGTTAHPTMLAGTFRFFTGVGTSATLTAKFVSSTTPVSEPSSLHLLAAGMLIALFFKLRR